MCSLDPPAASPQLLFAASHHFVCVRPRARIAGRGARRKSRRRANCACSFNRGIPLVTAFHRNFDPLYSEFLPLGPARLLGDARRALAAPQLGVYVLGVDARRGPEHLEVVEEVRGPAGADAGLERISTSSRRRRRDLPQRNIHVAAAAASRLVPTEYAGWSRGGVAIRLPGLSTSRPRRRRDSPPRTTQVAAAAASPRVAADYPRHRRRRVARRGHRISTLQPRRRREASPRNIYVATAAASRLVPTDYPRHRRGGVATRPHGLSASSQRRRRARPRFLDVAARRRHSFGEASTVFDDFCSVGMLVASSRKARQRFPRGRELGHDAGRVAARGLDDDLRRLLADLLRALVHALAQELGGPRRRRVRALARRLRTLARSTAPRASASASSARPHPRARIRRGEGVLFRSRRAGAARRSPRARRARAVARARP